MYYAFMLNLALFDLNQLHITLAKFGLIGILESLGKFGKFQIHFDKKKSYIQPGQYKNLQ